MRRKRVAWGAALALAFLVQGAAADIARLEWGGFTVAHQLAT